jgi:PAS domain S-box-containing protein
VDARFRRLFERLPEALLIESGGRITEVNAAAADLYRGSRRDLIGRAVSELWSETEAMDVESRRRALAEGGSLTLRGTGRRADGRTFPHEVTYAREPRDGDITFVLVRDLSDRQRFERGLYGLADLARLHGAEGSITTVAAKAMNLARQMLDADRAAVCSIQGDDTVEWLASHRLEPLIMASSNLRPSQIPWLKRALESGRAEVIDRRSPSHARSPLSDVSDQLGVVAFAIVPLRSGDELTGALGLVWSGDPPELAADHELLATIGRLVGLALGNIRLRDSLIARQQALDESEARYRNLFQEAPEPILIQSWEGAVLDANRAACALFGRSRREMLGRRTDQIWTISPDERAQLQAQLRRRRRGVARGRGRRSDGTTFPHVMDVAVTSLRGEERLLVQVRDLTEQERMQAELLQAQKMEALGQLISGVAHELNNPLSAIVAFSQLLRTDTRLPADLARDAELLVQEADRTRRIVQNLLDFARQRRPERQPASLRGLVERTLELHSYALGTGRIAAELDLADDLPPVHVDPAQIQQVLLNLTLNAIQAIRSRGRTGTISISASVTGPRRDNVCLRIEDDGPGVAPDVQEHLFEPFFTTKDVGEGTGLGLSVSYGIVTSHGGRLWFEPAQSGGAAFVIELPVGLGARAAVPVPAPIPGDPAPVAGGNGRQPATILAVDDEPAIRTMLERAMSRAGHRVVSAASGVEALQAIEQQSFDLLLIDHRMGGMDGIECYQRAVALRPELAGHAVIMSGDTLNPTLQEFAVASGLRMLAKPFDVARVLALVDEELVQAAQSRG